MCNVYFLHWMVWVSIMGRPFVEWLPFGAVDNEVDSGFDDVCVRVIGEYGSGGGGGSQSK